MEAIYKRDLNGTYLVMEEQGIREKDYQIYMLESNKIDGLIEIHVQGVNNVTQYCYNISGKNTIQAMYERSGIQADEIRQLVFQILSLVSETEAYLLDENKILLEPEYIFFANGKFYFCYYPFHRGNLHTQFHQLTEYLIRQVDCEDKEGICMAYELHKATMEENYSLQEAAFKILSFQKETDEESVKEPVTYTDSDDFIIQRDGKADYFRETRPGWKKTHGMFRKKKENYWGEFEDFYVEEEDLD